MSRLAKIMDALLCREALSVLWSAGRMVTRIRLCTLSTVPGVCRRMLKAPAVGRDRCAPGPAWLTPALAFRATGSLTPNYTASKCHSYVFWVSFHTNNMSICLHALDILRPNVLMYCKDGNMVGKCFV